MFDHPAGASRTVADAAATNTAWTMSCMKCDREINLLARHLAADLGRRLVCDLPRILLCRQCGGKVALLPS